MIWNSDFSRWTTCLVNSSSPLDYGRASTLSSLFTYLWIDCVIRGRALQIICRRFWCRYFCGNFRGSGTCLRELDRLSKLPYLSRHASSRAVSIGWSFISNYAQVLKLIFVCAKERSQTIASILLDHPLAFKSVILSVT